MMRPAPAWRAVVPAATALTLLAWAGGAQGATLEFTNPSAIDVPQGTNSPASIYPSTITVPNSGTIADVNVTLTDLSHGWPRDLDIFLEGPGGQKVMLMSDVCGLSEAAIDPSDPIDLTFDDAAASGLPTGYPLAAPCQAGSYIPTDNTPAGESLPAPAPVGPYGTLLSTFDGTGPNGTWRLWVANDEPDASGQIAGGWTLSIAGIAAPTQFDAASYPASVGTDAVLTVTRSGNGLGAATVDYATQDGTATGGTDFTPTSGTLSFAPGQASAQITVPITSQSTGQPAKSFSVALSSSTDDAGLGASATATVEIGAFTPPPPTTTPSSLPSSTQTTHSSPPQSTQATPSAPECASVPAALPAKARGGKVRVRTAQLLINQRISQAAVRRANAIQAWLDAKVARQDICGGAFGPADLGAGVQTGQTATSAATVQPTASPRPITVASRGRAKPASVTLAAAQILINQRISQAAVRRANALEERLDAGLTGGDLRPDAVSKGQLTPGLSILSATPAPNPPAPTTTKVAQARSSGKSVSVSAQQLLINQRISQAAVRRTNALIARLQKGLTGSDFQDGTVTTVNLDPALRS